MKLMKKVFVLSVIILSLGSSVAFGCDASKIGGAAIDQTKSLASSSESQSKDAPKTSAGSAEQASPQKE